MKFKLTKFDELLHSLLISKNFEKSLSMIIRDMQIEFNFQSLGIFLKTKHNNYKLQISRNLSHTYLKNTTYSDTDQLIQTMKYFKMIERKAPSEYKFEHNYSHLLIAPLHYQNNLLGFIFIDKKSDFFEDTEIIKFDMFASLISLIAHIHNQESVIEHNIEVDPSTGLLCSAVFYERIQPLFLKAKRYESNFSFIILKIKDYKKIFQTFGKEEIEHALYEIASILKNDLRPNELSSQIYPDTFAFLLLDTEPKSLTSVILRLQNLILEKSQLIKKGNLCWGISTLKETQNDLNEIMHLAESRAFEATRRDDTNIIMI